MHDVCMCLKRILYVYTYYICGEETVENESDSVHMLTESDNVDCWKCIQCISPSSASPRPLQMYPNGKKICVAFIET